MLHRSFKILLAVLIVAVMGMPLVIHADETLTITDPLIVASVGLYDIDGSIFYSVLAASGANDLSGLTVTSTVPEGATFVEAVEAPESATFVGEAGGIVTWQLESLAANTIVGPFTYRVTFPEGTEAPANTAASITWADGTAAAEIMDELLQVLEESGTLTVDAAGTDGLAAVGNTGILVDIPADAVSQPVTLTFTRLPITEESNLPDTENTWWCAMVSISADVEVAFAQPLTLVLPLRRVLTPGSPFQIAFSEAGSEWQIVESDETSYNLRGYARPTQQDARKIPDLVSYNGTQGLVSYNVPILAPKIDHLVAPGVKVTEKRQSTQFAETLGDPLMLNLVDHAKIADNFLNMIIHEKREEG